MKLIPAMVLCLTQAAFASDSVVVLDVERTCRTEATIDPTMPTSVQKCLEQEQSARAELAEKWQTFDPADRLRCVSETKLGGDPSYVEVLVCVTMAEDARKLQGHGAASTVGRSVK